MGIANPSRETLLDTGGRIERPSGARTRPPLSPAGGTQMSELSKGALLGLLPLAGLLAACGGGGGDGGGEGNMVVVAVTPTNGQETLTDMSDPELGGVLTVKFSETPDADSMIDDTNAFNGLT